VTTMPTSQRSSDPTMPLWGRKHRISRLLRRHVVRPGFKHNVCRISFSCIWQIMYMSIPRSGRVFQRGSTVTDRAPSLRSSIYNYFRRSRRRIIITFIFTCLFAAYSPSLRLHSLHLHYSENFWREGTILSLGGTVVTDLPGQPSENFEPIIRTLFPDISGIKVILRMGYLLAVVGVSKMGYWMFDCGFRSQNASFSHPNTQSDPPNNQSQLFARISALSLSLRVDSTKWWRLHERQRHP